MKLPDLASPGFKPNPYPFYARLRREAPISRIRFGRWLKGLLVTRYDDVVKILKDERLTKEPDKAKTAGATGREMWFARITAPLARQIVSLDPPDHTRLRALVQKAFTPRRVEDMRPRIESFALDLLDRVDSQRGMDVIGDYALPLTVRVIVELLGVPFKDRDRFQHWTAAVADQSGLFAVLRAATNGLTFLRYIRRLVDAHRRQPADDLISALIAAEEGGYKLDQTEMRAMVFFLLVAGYETTLNLIGNGALALLENRAEMEKLRAQPSLLPSAIEEFMRYDSPIELATPRWALCDIPVAGATIPRGALVWAGIASANRDPAQFDRPDSLDITREPNHHIAFGQGIHYCLGAPLARLEAQIAFRALLERFPGLRLVASRHLLRWRRSVVLRGLEELPVAF